MIPNMVFIKNACSNERLADKNMCLDVVFRIVTALCDSSWLTLITKMTFGTN